MTATYSPALATPLDRIRFTLGDTDVSVDETSGESNALKPDEEYLAVIALYSNEDEATATMAEALAAQVAQDPSSYSEGGGISLSWNERIRTWLAIAERLRTKLALAASATASGGSVSVRPSRWGDDRLGEYEAPRFNRWSNDYGR